MLDTVSITSPPILIVMMDDEYIHTYRVIGETTCKGVCGKQLEDLRQKIRSLTSAAQHAADSHSQQVASLRHVRPDFIALSLFIDGVGNF